MIPIDLRRPIEVFHAGIAGHVLRDMRLVRGWTQVQLAEAIGYNRTSITNMESGRQVITFDVMCTAAEALGFMLQLRATSIRR